MRALARAERRFRGLTETERDLLESTSVELVDEFMRVLEGLGDRRAWDDKDVSDPD